MSYAIASIPRFLLPQRGQIWRRAGGLWAANGGLYVPMRSTSSTPPPPPTGKRLVLEKPARFNPPSHGARLPKKQGQPKHYGGDLSAEEVHAQNVKEYPGMMAPPGTWQHWFLNSRGIHIFITMGTLSGLAIYTFVQNFKQTSPYIDMVPAWSDFLWHPFSSTATLMRVVQLSEEHNSAIVAAKREKRIDDVIKRKRFRKAHGMEEAGGVTGWLRSGGSGLRDPEEEEEATAAESAADGQRETVDATSTPAGAVDGQEEKEKRKKILGIF